MRLILPVLFAPLAAHADISVVTDIAPVHSLVAQVMEGAGTPDVLVSGGASPHDFQFTFDQASAVQEADVIIWVGEGLTPWLEESLQTLAPDVAQLELLHTDGWEKLELRDWDDGHDHGHGHDDHDDHDDAHDDHDEANDTGHDHDHGDDHGGDHAVDPHAWLNPQTAIVWTTEIARTLAAADPDNAALYTANAQTTIARLTQLDTDIAAQMAALSDASFLVPHDAYQYFGARYGVLASGAISLSDASAPSPDTIADLQGKVRDGGVVCVLSDPQSRSAWVDLVREGSDARTALADPIGTQIALGVDHYDLTLRALAAAYEECLGG